MKRIIIGISCVVVIVLVVAIIIIKVKQGDDECDISYTITDKTVVFTVTYDNSYYQKVNAYAGTDNRINESDTDESFLGRFNAGSVTKTYTIENAADYEYIYFIAVGKNNDISKIYNFSVSKDNSGSINITATDTLPE